MPTKSAPNTAVPPIPNRLPFTNAQLLAYRQHVDPPADSLIESVYTTGQISEVQSQLVQMTQNDSPPPPGLPTSFQQFLQTYSQLPPWYDATLAAAGQQLFMDHKTFMILGLCFSSLPQLYLDGDACEMLALSQNFQLHSVRRVFQTLDLLVFSAQPGGYTPTGKGIIAAQKVRLLHGVIRKLMRGGHNHVPLAAPAHVPDKKQWNIAIGQPANQVDLIYTMLTFSSAMPRALARFDIKLTDGQRNSLVHVWNVMAYFMGGTEDLLPNNYQEADSLFQQIKSMQSRSTSAGIAMTEAHENVLYHFIPLFKIAHYVWFFLVLWLNGVEDALKDGLLRRDGESLLRTLKIKIPTHEEAKAAPVPPELVASMRPGTVALALPPEDSAEFLDLLQRIMNWVVGVFGDWFYNQLNNLPPQWNPSTFALPTELRWKWDPSA